MLKLKQNYKKKHVCIAFTKYACDNRTLQNSIESINIVDLYHVNIDVTIIMSIQSIGVITECCSCIV